MRAKTSQRSFFSLAFTTTHAQKRPAFLPMDVEVVVDDVDDGLLLLLLMMKRYYYRLSTHQQHSQHHP